MTYRPLQARPNGIYWFILQTYDAAKIAFRRQWHLLANNPQLLRKKPNESDLIIPLINGANVFYKSGEVFENLRAETLDGCVIDEYRQQHAELFPRVIRPMLAKHSGWCDILSTGNGFDHFFDLWEFAGLHPDEWSRYHAPATECWWWTPEEIASAKALMSEAEFAQEIMAEFRDLKAGRAYVNYGQHNQLMSSPFCRDGGLVNPYLPIIVSPDFNLNPMSWGLGQQKGEDFYYFDHIHLPSSHTPEASKELVHRLLILKGQNLMRSTPQIIICGDATSKAGQRAAAGKSDYDIMLQELKTAGFSFSNRTPESNPTVKDRVNNFNAKLRAADGRVHFWLHPVNCAPLHKDLQRVVWKQGVTFTLDQTTDPSLTHASDGPGYTVSALSPIPDIRPAGKLRILLR